MNLRRYIKKDGSEVLQILTRFVEMKDDILGSVKEEWQDIPTVYEEGE